MWRISDDFWDTWPQLLRQFKRLHDWTPLSPPGPGRMPTCCRSATIELGRKTNFTPDEQITLMTLWCIARSPLMHGGDMTKTDDFTLSLLTNDEVLAVNQRSSNNRQLFRTDDDLIAWVADVPDSASKYLAVFNTRDGDPADIPVKLADTGLTGKVRVRDLWKKQDIGLFENEFSSATPAHGSRLFRLTAVK